MRAAILNNISPAKQTAQ